MIKYLFICALNLLSLVSCEHQAPREIEHHYQQGKCAEAPEQMPKGTLKCYFSADPHDDTPLASKNRNVILELSKYKLASPQSAAHSYTEASDNPFYQSYLRELHYKKTGNHTAELELRCLGDGKAAISHTNIKLFFTEKNQGTVLSYKRTEDWNITTQYDRGVFIIEDE